MTIKILEADGKLNPEELDFFLKGNISLEKSSRTKPFPWLPDQGWEDIQRLITVTPEAFSSLADDIERNGQAWKEVWFLRLIIVWYDYLPPEPGCTKLRGNWTELTFAETFGTVLGAGEKMANSRPAHHQ